MKHRLLYFAAVLFASTTLQANASTYQISFGGAGVSGNVVLTYGSATDAKYPQAFEITGVSGTFTDANLGIFNTAITGLEPITHATPDVTNLLAPKDFSRFAVAAGTMDGSLSFDNLFWPTGSPQTATDYPFHGGILDIYGLLFDIGGGRVVNLWSNGVLPGAPLDYGVAVANSATTLDYTGGVAVTPEPSTVSLFSTGLLAIGYWRRRAFLRA